MCVCLSLFPDSLRSLFLTAFVPPAGAPGKERRCQRLTVSSYLRSKGTNQSFQFEFYGQKTPRKSKFTHPPFSSHVVPSFSVTFFLTFSVGQVKFDPPLRKETEPHHEPVSYYLSDIFVYVWVGAIMFVWLSLHQYQHGRSSPNHRKHPNQSTFLSICVEPNNKPIHIVHSGTQAF